jgi:hypothetical protein
MNLQEYAVKELRLCAYPEKLVGNRVDEACANLDRADWFLMFWTRTVGRREGLQPQTVVRMALSCIDRHWDLAAGIENAEALRSAILVWCDDPTVEARLTMERIGRKVKVLKNKIDFKKKSIARGVVSALYEVARAISKDSYGRLRLVPTMVAHAAQAAGKGGLMQNLGDMMQVMDLPKTDMERLEKAIETMGGDDEKEAVAIRVDR